MTHKTILTIILLAILCCGGCTKNENGIVAQYYPDIPIMKIYRNGYWGRGLDLLETIDGGFVIAGWTGGTLSKFLLIKTNAEGDSLWARTFGGTNNDYGRAIALTADGGYMIAGSTNSFGAGGYDAYVIKTDVSGNQLWSKTFGGQRNDEIYSIQPTRDGNYILAGYSNVVINGYNYEPRTWLMKIDVNGNQLWSQTYLPPLYNVSINFISVIQTNDNGYLINTSKASFDANATVQRNLLLIKTDENGDTLWSKTHHLYGRTFGIKIQQSVDGGFVVFGYGAPADQSNNDMSAFILKTDIAGNQQWIKRIEHVNYGNFNLTQGGGVSGQQTSDGGYLIAYHTRFYPDSGSRSNPIVLTKTDPNGNVIWTTLAGRNDFNIPFALVQTHDGNFAMTGFNAKVVLWDKPSDALVFDYLNAMLIKIDMQKCNPIVARRK